MNRNNTLPIDDKNTPPSQEKSSSIKSQANYDIIFINTSNPNITNNHIIRDILIKNKLSHYIQKCPIFIKQQQNYYIYDFDDLQNQAIIKPIQNNQNLNLDTLCTKLQPKNQKINNEATLLTHPSIPNELYTLFIKNGITDHSYRHLPYKGRDFLILKECTGNIFTHTFHSFYKTQKKISKKEIPLNIFFKICKNITAEIESANRHVYEILAGLHLVPKSTHAYYSQNNVPMGIGSTELKDFKPLAENPLKEEHIKIACMEQYPDTLLHLEALDNQYLLEKNIDLFGTDAKKFYREIILRSPYNEQVDRINVSYGEMRNYHIIKNQATMLTTMYYLCENDGHASNLDLTGKRIDFDKSLFPFVYEIINLIDKPSIFTFHIRDSSSKPGTNQFLICPEVIKDFPDIKEEYRPFYHVCQTESSYSNWTPNIKNFYSKEQSKVFAQLKDNPIFIFHKLKTLLKIILTPEKIYTTIADLYLSNNYEVDVKRKYSEFLCNRSKSTRSTLVKMPEFMEFLCKYGHVALDLIFAEYKKINESIKGKCEKKPYYQSLLFDIEDIKQKFKMILKENIINTIKSYHENQSQKNIFSFLLDVKSQFQSFIPDIDQLLSECMMKFIQIQFCAQKNSFNLLLNIKDQMEKIFPNEKENLQQIDNIIQENIIEAIRLEYKNKSKDEVITLLLKYILVQPEMYPKLSTHPFSENDTLTYFSITKLCAKHPAMWQKIRIALTNMAEFYTYLGLFNANTGLNSTDKVNVYDKIRENIFSFYLFRNAYYPNECIELPWAKTHIVNMNIVQDNLNSIIEETKNNFSKDKIHNNESSEHKIGYMKVRNNF